MWSETSDKMASTVQLNLLVLLIWFSVLCFKGITCRLDPQMDTMLKILNFRLELYH